MDSKSVTDKNDKVKFLELLIDCTQRTSGKKINVRVSKIIAGQEPENTNLLLQEIAHCVLNKMSTEEAVKEIKSGKSAKKESSKSKKEDAKENQKTREKSEKSRNREKTADSAEKSENRTLKDKQSKEKSKSVRKDSKPREKSKPKEELEKSEKTRDKSEHREKREKSKSRKKETEEERAIRKEREREERHRRRKERDGGEERPSRPPRPTSAKGERRPAPLNPEENDLERTQVIRPAAASVRARPGSARPSRRPQQHADPIETVPQVNPNVILDDDDEEEELVVELDPNTEIPVTSVNSEELLANPDEHGALVRDILNTKNTSGKSQDKSKVSVISQAEEEKLRVQFSTIRGEIQSITRTTAPIGRVLDFIQEDVDAMQNEYDLWTEELENNLAQIKQFQTQKNTDLSTFHEELASLENSIAQKRREIISTKQQILLNEQNIEKQLQMIFSS